MCSLGLRETILAVLCGIVEGFISFTALCTLSEKAFRVHWLNWETVQIFPRYPMLSKFRKKTTDRFYYCVAWFRVACQAPAKFVLTVHQDPLVCFGNDTKSSVFWYR